MKRSDENTAPDFSNFLADPAEVYAALNRYSVEAGRFFRRSALGADAVLVWRQVESAHVITLATLAEKRTIERRSTAYRGEQLSRGPEDASTWSVQVDAPEPPATCRREVTLPGSEHVADCGSCERRGQAACSACNGAKRARCTDCYGQGLSDCTKCQGQGRVGCGYCTRGLSNCGACGGRGGDCGACNGRGLSRCTNCRGAGEAVCRACKGQRRLRCNTCGGQGETVCFGCAGKGRVTCDGCEGAGRIKTSQVLIVDFVLADDVHVEGPPEIANDVRTAAGIAWYSRAAAPPANSLSDLPAALATPLANMISARNDLGEDVRVAKQVVTITAVPVADIRFTIGRGRSEHRARVVGLDHRVRAELPLDWSAIQVAFVAIALVVWLALAIANPAPRWAALGTVAAIQLALVGLICGISKLSQRRRTRVDAGPSFRRVGGPIATAVSLVALVAHVSLGLGINDQKAGWILAHAPFAGSIRGFLEPVAEAAKASDGPRDRPPIVAVEKQLFVRSLSAVLRGGPTSKDEAIATLKYSTACSSTTTAGVEWLKVRCGGASGWLRRDLVQDDTPTLEGVRSAMQQTDTPATALEWATKAIIVAPDEESALADYRSRYAVAMRANLVRARSATSRRATKSAEGACGESEAVESCIASALMKDGAWTWVRVEVENDDFVAVAGQAGDALGEFAGALHRADDLVDLRIEQASRYRSEVAARALRSSASVSPFRMRAQQMLAEIGGDSDAKPHPELITQSPAGARSEPRFGVSHVRGNFNAPVRLIIYADFECPFSARWRSTIEEVRSIYGDKVAVAFKHYPLPFHSNARSAALAAIAAQDQGRFWEMHDVLFANQRALNQENYLGWAKDLGLDLVKFEQAVNAPANAARVDQELAEGAKFGVSGTPTTFINGRLVSGAQPLDAVKAIIEDVLRER